MSESEIYMQRCLDLAQLAHGNTAPNPMVGAVIVHDGIIIGEGYHRCCGEAHAEVNAINSVEDQTLLKESTLYVSLEPCSHFGKTPPCADFIIARQIPKVIIGCSDTSSKVAGKGIERLKQAGCTVITGVLENECRKMNKRFFTFNEKKRPYIILKWAQTLDGFIDIERISPEQKGAWITNDISKITVHKWRSQEQAIMIGTNTALLDNPKLTTRLWQGKDPLRITLDQNLELPLTLNLFDHSVNTLVFTEIEKEMEINLQYKTIKFDKQLISNILKELYSIDIQSVIVEGGEQLLNSFIHQNLWDEARVFTGNTIFTNGTSAPKIEGAIQSEEQLEDTFLRIYKNDKIK